MNEKKLYTKTLEDLMEWGTPLSEETHRINGIVIWIFLESSLVGISSSIQIKKEGDINLIDLNDLESCRNKMNDQILNTLNLNKTLIKTYSAGVMCTSDLIEKFKNIR